jgi:hypothetical protein
MLIRNGALRHNGEIYGHLFYFKNRIGWNIGFHIESDIEAIGQG